MKKLLLSISTLCSLSLSAQNIVFTDANLKAALVAHSPIIDTSGDGEISVQEAEFYTAGINVSSQGIVDMDGIENFKKATQLICWGNSIVTLDLTGLDSLIDLSCNNNSLTSINTSTNFNLKTCNVFSNSLTTLDVSANTKLTAVSCFNNQLTIINVQNGNNTNMQFSGSGNPNACIQVDDVNYSQNAFNWSEDATATYTLSCSTTGIEEQALAYSFYPNPVVNELNVIAPDFSRLEVMDLSGKKVLTSYQSTTSLNSLKKGVYFLTVYNLNGNFKTEKIIKQ